MIDARADRVLALDAPRPYDLARSVSLLRMGSRDPTMRIRPRRVLIGFEGPEGPALCEAVHAGDRVDVSLHGPGAAWLAPRVPALLGLDDAPETFRPEPGPIAGLQRRFSGLHLPRTPRVSTRIAQVILQQLVTWREAAQAWARLARTLGEPAAPGLALAPAPARIAAATVGELVACGMLPRQARTLREFARRASRIEAAAAAGPADLARALGSIAGVGPWTVAYVLGTALGDPDAVLLGDADLPRLVGWVLAREPRCDDARMLELLSPYEGHRFRAIRLLWLSRVRPPRLGGTVGRPGGGGRR